ncbi:MAG TPA: tyrosine-type recombinase/integrase [Gemmataceae bacterium]|nr:tyrosine-type recombinase/integrase [Gemmataceae bacterium]
MEMRSLIAEFVDKMMVDHRLAARTILSYQASLRQWAAFVEARSPGEAPSVQQFTRPVVRLWLHALHDRGLTPQSVALRMSALREFGRWLVSAGHVDENAAAAVPIPKAPKRLPMVLTEPEVLRMLDQPCSSTFSGLRLLAELHVLYSTGCRIGELLALDVADVDLERRRVKLSGEKSKQERLAFLYPSAAAVLESWLRLRQASLSAAGLPLDGPVFCTWQGRREIPKSVQTGVKASAISAALSPAVTPHTLRHCFASAMIAGGCDLASLKVLMGHSSLVTTGHYVQVTPTRMLEEFRRTHPRA